MKFRKTIAENIRCASGKTNANLNFRTNDSHHIIHWNGTPSPDMSRNRTCGFDSGSLYR